MKRLQFVVSLVVLFAAVPAFTQSKGAKSDPVSGTWAGEMQLGHASGAYQIELVLKFDGSSAVTGTFTGLPSPGDVKKGTFDPKTGALKLRTGQDWQRRRPHHLGGHGGQEQGNRQGRRRWRRRDVLAQPTRMRSRRGRRQRDQTEKRRNGALKARAGRTPARGRRREGEWLPVRKHARAVRACLRPVATRPLTARCAVRPAQSP